MSFLQDWLKNRKERNEFVQSVEEEAREIRREAYKQEMLKQAEGQGAKIAVDKINEPTPFQKVAKVMGNITKPRPQSPNQQKKKPQSKEQSQTKQKDLAKEFNDLI